MLLPRFFKEHKDINAVCKALLEKGEEGKVQCSSNKNNQLSRPTTKCNLHMQKTLYQHFIPVFNGSKQASVKSIIADGGQIHAGMRDSGLCSSKSENIHVSLSNVSAL